MSQEAKQERSDLEESLRARVAELEAVLNRIVNEPAVMGPDARWMQSFAREALNPTK